MNEEGFNSVSIIGVGLIGGSLALALKNKGLAKYIVGYGRNPVRLKEAQKLGVIDEFTLSLRDVASTELIVLATPLGNFEEIVREMSPLLNSKNILIDVGSVKMHVIKTIEQFIHNSVNFIPTHPIAGSERTGFENAKADLFKDARVVITPTERTNEFALERIKNMWQSIGAFVELMSAEEHDRIYALMSHLPHFISFCLVNTVDAIDRNLIIYSGSGFKDTTRIAKSSPDIWKDILLMNRDKISEMLDVFICKLDELKKLILKDNSDKEIIEFIERAKKLRQTID